MLHRKSVISKCILYGLYFPFNDLNSKHALNLRLDILAARPCPCQTKEPDFGSPNWVIRLFENNIIKLSVLCTVPVIWLACALNCRAVLTYSPYDWQMICVELVKLISFTNQTGTIIQLRRNGYTWIERFILLYPVCCRSYTFTLHTLGTGLPSSRTRWCSTSYISAGLFYYYPHGLSAFVGIRTNFFPFCQYLCCVPLIEMCFRCYHIMYMRHWACPALTDH